MDVWDIREDDFASVSSAVAAGELTQLKPITLNMPLSMSPSSEAGLVLAG